MMMTKNQGWTIINRNVGIEMKNGMAFQDDA